MGCRQGAPGSQALGPFPRSAAPADAFAAPAEVPLLADQAALQSTCLEAGGLCVLACLPADAADAGTKGGPLGALRALASKRAEQPLRFAWVAAVPEHRAFAAALGIESPPALAALAPRKRRFATFSGRFEEDAIAEWLDGLLAGRVRTAALPDELPPLAGGGGVAGGAAGDDAVGAEAMEDEFSLEDIMAEKVAMPVRERPHDEL